MPRIRKKTSNRASTNDRAKVRHKVKETKKKKAKAAKKNPQWKSRTPKDPGIPNEFPYKDRILAEVAEQRRMAAEEKELRKAEKQRALKKARAIARGEVVEDDSAEEGDDEEELKSEEEEEEEANGKLKKNLNVGADSIASLSAKLVKGELKPRPRPISEREKDTEEVEEREEVPVLINRDLPTLQSVLEKADVVLEVVDARDPMVFRSEHVESLVRDTGKKVLLVLNKIDTCPREALTAWTGHLRPHCPTLMFRSATAFLPEGPTLLDPLVRKVKGKGKAKIPIDDALGAESVLSCLSQWAKEKKGDEALSVAVVGLANVGKSSLINSLLKRTALPIYTLTSSSRGPSTTEIPQEVTLEVDSQKIVLIDTPGLSFTPDEDANQSTLEEFRARDILLRSKGRIDRLKDPRPPVAHIVSQANAEDLMLLYSLPAFTKGDSTAFLSGVARANQLLKKKGELDLTGAARIVLRDWSLGKLSRYTTPPAPSVNATAAQLSTTAKLTNLGDNLSHLYDNDEAILSTIQTRKERRKQGGIVKFVCGSIDPRKVTVEEPWDGLGQNDDKESDDDDVDVEEMEVDGEEDEENVENDSEVEGEEASDAETEDSQEGEEDDEDEDEDEDESEIDLARLSHKQKRKRGAEKSMLFPPTKKVAFSALPHAGSKSNRSKIEALTKGKTEPMKIAPQKKKPLKPVQVSSSAARKGLSKPGSSIPVQQTSEKKGKVANITAKTKVKGNLAVAGKPKSKGESEVYDFGKFF